MIRSLLNPTPRLTRAALLAFSLSGVLSAASVYAPEAGAYDVSATYSHQSFDDFWFGSTKATLPGKQIQQTVQLDLAYGATDKVAVDLQVGYSQVHYDGGPLGSIVLQRNGEEAHGGLSDLRVGVSLQLADEFDHPEGNVPSIAIRVGAIIQGTYDTGFVNTIGDGAEGFDIGILFGKYFSALGAGIVGDFDYRFMAQDVPDAYTYSITAYKVFGAFSLFAGIREEHSVDGLDILGPGFSLAAFPTVHEINKSYELGASYRFNNGATVGLGYAETYDGENTPKKHVISLRSSMAF